MNKKGFMRKRGYTFVAFMLLMVMLLTSFDFVRILASGEENGPKEYNDVFKNVIVKSKAGAILADNAEHTVGQWETVKIEAEFELPNNKVKANDISKIEIPTSMFIMPITEIRDAEGKVVAKVSINNRNQKGNDDKTLPKELILTYTDYVQNKSDVKGRFFFEIRVDHTIELEKKDIPLEIKLDKNVTYNMNLKYKGFMIPDPVVFGKSGWYFDDKTKSEEERKNIGTLQYRLQVNQTKKAIKDAKIIDRLETEKTEIRMSSINVKKGNWTVIMGSYQLRTGEKNEKTSIDVTNDVVIKPDLDKRGFTIEVGNIAENEGYEITYFVDTLYPAQNGEVFKNNAKLVGNEEEIASRPTSITYAVGGGKAEGSIYSIKIVKQDMDNGEVLLQGAEFDVIRKRSGVKVGSLKTDEKGEAKIGALLKDIYIVKETKAPEGYESGNLEFEIQADEFDPSTKLATKVVTNKKKVPVVVVPTKEKISIPVTKQWVGEEKEKVVVQLMADGVLKDTRELSLANNWKDSFTELDKVDEKGNPIVYTIDEVDVIGYKKDIKLEDSTDITKGVNILNTKEVVQIIPEIEKEVTPEEKVETEPEKPVVPEEKVETEPEKPVVPEEKVEAEPEKPVAIEENPSVPVPSSPVDVSYIAEYIPVSEEKSEELPKQTTEPEKVEVKEEVAVKDEGSEILEDEIPLSPTPIVEESEELETPEGDEDEEVAEGDIVLEEDETPRGETDLDGDVSATSKRLLAKTGGLKSYLIPIIMILAILGTTFVGLGKLRQKEQ